MKIRESGMPEREMWDKFFNPANILATLGLNSQTVDVAEVELAKKERNPVPKFKDIEQPALLGIL